MDIICNKNKLTDAVRTVQKAVSAKTVNPILKGILFEAYTFENSGYLKLVGNDLSIGIECIIEAQVSSPGTFVVMSNLFGDLVTRMSDGDIRIVSDSAGSIVLISDQARFNVQTLNPDEFPSLPVIEIDKYIDIEASVLSNIVRQTRVSISADESKPVITGALFEVEGGNINFVSIDGFRMSVKKIKIDKDFNFKSIVPGKTLSELQKILQGIDDDTNVKISFTLNHILFEMGEIKVISRLIEGEFIKYSQIIPSDYTTRVIVNRDHLNDSVDRVSVLIREGRANSFKMSISNNNIKINSLTDVGSSSETIPATVEGHSIEIGFSCKYIVDAFKIINTEDIILEFTTPVSPCVIKPNSDEELIYIVLPVRIYD